MAQTATVTWNGKAVSRMVAAAAMRGTTMWGEFILTGARVDVPLDEGTLERSGRVISDERRISATVSFDTPYAVVQHEDLTFRHAPGRRAKYLERPWRASKRIGPNIVAKQIRKVTA